MADEDTAPGFSHAISGSVYSGGTWAAKVAVITGAGSGIGEAIAYAAADRGMSVVRCPSPRGPFPPYPATAAALLAGSLKHGASVQVLADIDEEALARVAEECTDIRESLGVRASPSAAAGRMRADGVQIRAVGREWAC